MSNRTVALAGNPNVGKSTVFNELTGMHRHTGNWIGKTVDAKESVYYYKYNDYTVVDLPGTYSLLTASPEEELAADFIMSGKADCTVCVVDSTLLERSLVLVYQILNITNKAVVLLNLNDEAEKKGIAVDEKALSEILGVPVVKATARSGKGINALLEQVHLITTGALVPRGSEYTGEDDIYGKAKETAALSVKKIKKDRENPLDKIMLGKYTSPVAMLIMLSAVLFITVKLSNYPSELLKSLFDSLEELIGSSMLKLGISEGIVNAIAHGVLRVLFWVVAVMLPPMAIFFPLFSLLEDFGILPRVAFNLDYCFEKCGACGKQSLTCCMGMGCNAVGVTGARIIETKRERLLAILTNSFIPCNGRFPILITVIAAFFTGKSALSSLILCALLVLSIGMSMLASRVLSKTVLKGMPSSFVMEMPPYRKPQILKTVLLSMRDKVLSVLLRAVAVAAPAGLIIYLLANINIEGGNLLLRISDILNPLGHVMGLDGAILLAFILGFPANEIVLPILLMIYLSSSSLGDFSSLSSLAGILITNGWTVKTALCVCIFTLFHFPCSTTVLTVYKETRSLKWTAMSVIVPLITGILICSAVNLTFTVFPHY